MTFAFAALLIFAGGCSNLGSLLGSNKPSARIVGAKLADLSLTSATLNFDVELSNPYAVPLPLTNVEYSLASGGTAFLSGNAQLQGTVPAKGSKVVTVPAKLDFARVLGAVKGISPGAVVPYEAKVTLSVDAPAPVGTLSLPLDKKGEFPIPTIPSFELTEVQWQNLSFEKATAVLRIKMANRNQFPIDLSKLALNLSLANTPIVTTSLAQSAKFEGGQENTLEIPITFAPKDLGFAAFQVLRGENAGYKLSGTANLVTPFGAMDVPYEKTGDARFRK